VRFKDASERMCTFNLSYFFEYVPFE